MYEPLDAPTLVVEKYSKGAGRLLGSSLIFAGIAIMLFFSKFLPSPRADTFMYLLWIKATFTIICGFALFGMKLHKKGATIFAILIFGAAIFILLPYVIQIL